MTKVTYVLINQDSYSRGEKQHAEVEQGAQLKPKRDDFSGYNRINSVILIPGDETLVKKVVEDAVAQIIGLCFSLLARGHEHIIRRHI